MTIALIIISVLLVGLAVAYMITFKEYLSSKIVVKKFLSVYGPTDAKPELLHIGTFSGKKFYAFKNHMEIPQKRAEEAEIYTKFASLNMTEDWFRQKIAVAYKSLNEQDFIKAAVTVKDLIDRTEFAAEEVSLTRLAASLVLIEGENPRVPEPKFYEMKKQIIETDSEANAFFLTYSYRTMKNLQNLSETDFLLYLKNNEIKKQFQRENRGKLLSSL